jgi:hypothetical protein
MRYRLRTLMIVLALGPPLLAVAWYLLADMPGLIGGVLVVALAISLGMFWRSLIREADA